MLLKSVPDQEQHIGRVFVLAVINAVHPELDAESRCPLLPKSAQLDSPAVRARPEHPGVAATAAVDDVRALRLMSVS